ncbi:MAG: TIM-barrel domain-containing protein [Balneolaceae bacterium]
MAQSQTDIGNLENYHQSGDQFIFNGTGGDIRLEFHTPSIVRVQGSWDGTFSDPESLMVPVREWPSAEITVTETDETIGLDTGELFVNVHKEPFLLEFFDADGTLLNSEIIPGRNGGTVKEGNVVRVEKRLFPDEHFFGFGERMDFMDQRGKKIELNVGRGIGFPHIVGAYNILDANYSPIPFFMSTRGYGIFFSTPYPTEWDMGHSLSDSYSYQATGGQIDYYFIYGPGFPSILDQYTEITGKSPLLPEFAHGLNVGTYSGGTWGYEHLTSTDYVVNLGRRFREERIPVDVLHLDSTWRIFGPNGTGSTTFEWRETFDNPEAMFDSLYAMDFNMVGVHVRPRYDNGNRFNLLDRAREEGMVYPEPGNTGEFVNFFDDEAVDWWWENAASMVVDQGAMFFKTDEGSAFSHPANESDRTGPVGEGTDRLHNLFPIVYTQAPFEKFREENGMRGMNLTREGYAGIQRYPYIFAGDWPSEWQYFAPVIKAGLNIGLSGVGYWAHCMGGFEHDADPELYIRWSQFGLMSSVAHLFGMDHPGYKEPWNYGEEALEIFTLYDRLRYRLLPYIYSEARNMHETGIPLMRALVLEYQDDENVYDIGDQYMFGSNLMIAPVTTKGAQTRVVYFPKGTWYDYWTGEEIEGRQYLNVVTPLEKLPMYVKAGGILPQRNRIEQVGEMPADTITVELFPHGDSSFELYDDDGTSEEYMTGEYAVTRIESSDNEQQTDVRIAAPEGAYEVPERNYALKIHTQAAPAEVQEAGETIPSFSDSQSYTDNNQAGWYYNEEDGILYVRTNGNSTRDLEITIVKQ